MDRIHGLSVNLISHQLQIYKVGDDYEVMLLDQLTGERIAGYGKRKQIEALRDSLNQFLEEPEHKCLHCGSTDVHWHPAKQTCHDCEKWRLRHVTGLQVICHPRSDGTCSHTVDHGRLHV